MGYGESANTARKISGFTLIELIVVISIMALLLSFSFPVFRDIQLFSNASTQVGDIVRLIDDLKKRAVEQNTDFVLHVDTGSGTLWITHDAMDDEAKQAARQKGVPFSPDLTLSDIEFPGVETRGTLEYRIRFSRKGYSDFALIHMVENENNITLKVEPFLSRVQVLDTHVSLDDCI